MYTFFTKEEKSQNISWQNWLLPNRRRRRQTWRVRIRSTRATARQRTSWCSSTSWRTAAPSPSWRWLTLTRLSPGPATRRWCQAIYSQNNIFLNLKRPHWQWQYVLIVNVRVTCKSRFSANLGHGICRCKLFILMGYILVYIRGNLNPNTRRAGGVVKCPQ